MDNELVDLIKDISVDKEEYGEIYGRPHRYGTITFLNGSFIDFKIVEAENYGNYIHEIIYDDDIFDSDEKKILMDMISQRRKEILDAYKLELENEKKENIKRIRKQCGFKD